MDSVRLGAILGSGASGEVRLATVSTAEPSHELHRLASPDGDGTYLELSAEMPNEAAQGRSRLGCGPQAAIVTPGHHRQQHKTLALKCVWVDGERRGRADTGAVPATGSGRSRGKGSPGSEAQSNALRHEACVLERLRGCPGVVQLLTQGVVTATAKLPSPASNESVNRPPFDTAQCSPTGQGSRTSEHTPLRLNCAALGVEFVPGGSLSDLRKRWWQQQRAPLPPSVLRHCIREATAALACVHGRGVVHGDVKGRNVLLAADGSVRLCDFGSASILWEVNGGRGGEGSVTGGAAAQLCPCMHRDSKQEGGSAGRHGASGNEAKPPAPMGADVAEGEASSSPSACPLPCAHRAPGTIFWMSPEAARQQPLSPASDVWSLGCLLLEMASGVPPWSSNCTPVSALYRIACTPDLPAIPISLSPEGGDFASLCLRRDPVQRPSAADLLRHPFLLNAAAGTAAAAAAAAAGASEGEKGRGVNSERRGHGCGRVNDGEDVLGLLLPPCCIDVRSTALCGHPLCSQLLRRTPAPLRVELPFPPAGCDGDEEGEEEDGEEEEGGEEAGWGAEQAEGCVVCSWRALSSSRASGTSKGTRAASSVCEGDLPSPTSVLDRSYEGEEGSCACGRCASERVLEESWEVLERSAGSVSFEIDPHTREPTIRDVALC